jgi:hypothetical protein
MFILCTAAIAAACSNSAHVDSARRAPREMRDTAVLLAAGDVAQCSPGSGETAALLDSLPGEIVVVGDAAYASDNVPNPYTSCYARTWGRHLGRTRPLIGNHDAQTLRMYFDYFGAAAGPRPDGYYSFDAGRWHVLALNSTIDMRRGSPQVRWAAADLAQNRGACAIAFMHHPRFSSGPHGSERLMRAMWETLARAGVDVVVAAHDHIYERFAPMRPDGTRDDTSGMRSFIVGTGGAFRYPIVTPHPNSEEASGDAHGILKLTLFPGSYAWEFVPTARSEFRDSGRGTCH